MRHQGDGEAGRELEAVRSYWSAHVQHWPIATGAVGTRRYFEETEAYRFEKLDYLERRIDYRSYPGRRLLDVGCGLGNDTARFAAAGAEVVGIDITERAIELARLNFAQRGLSGSFAVMDGEMMALAPESFDLVYCHTVLHFTSRPEAMVKEIHRVLKPGGEAILMAVNRRSWMRAMHRLAKVEIDHLAAPIFHWLTIDAFDRLLSAFPTRTIVAERFPVRTKVHKGAKALLFNALFVDAFNALPRSWVQGFGHHLLAFVRKAGG